MTVAALFIVGCAGEEPAPAPPAPSPVMWEATDVTVDDIAIADAVVSTDEAFTVAGTLVRVGEDGPGETFPDVGTINVSTGKLNVGSGVVEDIGPGGGFETVIRAVPRSGTFEVTFWSAGGEAEAQGVPLGELTVVKP